MNEIRSKQHLSVSNLTGPQRNGLLLALLLTMPLSAVQAAPNRPLQGVRTLYDLGGQGNAYFNAQLRREITGAGFRFVRSRKAADATLATQGDWTKNGGFAGSVTFRNSSGRVLWRKNVVRPANSRVMAFESLSRELRAVK